MTRTPEPSWWGLGLAYLPFLAVMLILAWRGLGQVQRLAIASARLVAQLAILGLVLGWVFAARSPWVTLGVAGFMLATSAQTVGSRQGRSGWGLRLQALASMTLGAVVVMVVATRWAMRVDPWYDPRIILPLLGMILGNSVNGLALAAERLESELKAGRDQVELRLALGATPRQAALPALKAAVRAALTPAINGMMIAGVVSIPGMSAGQILAGAGVGTAMRYQVLVYFGITATVGISTLILLALRLRLYFNADQQLRGDRLGDGGA